MSLDKLSFMADVSEIIAEETKRCYQQHNEGQPITSDGKPRFGLIDYRNSCQSLGKQMLSDELLAEQLLYFKDRLEQMRELFTSGMRVLVTLFPCDASGVKYNLAGVKNNPHFHVLRQEKASGFYFGYVNSLATPHALLLPKEIQEQCSFVVSFQAAHPEHQLYGIDEKDWQDFERKFTKAFISLRTLLGITHSA